MPHNPTVTMRLTHDEFVRFVANHSNHFTCECGKRVAGELADTRRKITCTRHGESCTAEYRDDWYWVSTSAYDSEDAAWRDVYADTPQEQGHLAHPIGA